MKRSTKSTHYQNAINPSMEAGLEITGWIDLDENEKVQHKSIEKMKNEEKLSIEKQVDDSKFFSN